MTRPMTLTTCALVATIGFAALVAAPSQAATTPSTTIFRGSFTGTAKYTGSGTATVVKKGTARTLKLAGNFKADRRSIRLRMYLATDAGGRTFVDLGPMAETGAQSFRIPSKVKLGTYRYAIAWCAAVNEPIARTKLNPVK